MEEFRTQILNDVAAQAGLPRRQFLRSLGLAAGGAGLLSLGVRPALAQGSQPSALDVAQFALALEHLEAVFYEQGVQLLGNQPGLARDQVRLVEIATIVRGHEQTHEQALAAFITCAGATPVPRCEYQFPFRDMKSFLQVSKALEETGVMAYLGAVPLLAGTPAVLVEASKIVTMEARHASIFRSLLGEADPLSGTGALPTCSGGFGNGAFDRLASIPEVKAKAAPFITSAVCPPLKP